MNKLEILKQIIKERKSTFPKDYTEKEIPTELIEDIVNTSISAPNHKRTKPWKFIIFQGEEKQKLGLELQSIYKKMMPKEYVPNVQCQQYRLLLEFGKNHRTYKRGLYIARKPKMFRTFLYGKFRKLIYNTPNYEEQEFHRYFGTTCFHFVQNIVQCK